MKKLILSLCLSLATVGLSWGDSYIIDTKGAHAYINFRVSHLGYSWLSGRFNKFSGSFNYDKNNSSANTISLTIDPSSVDSNHAVRDKHLRGEKFLDVANYPDAGFVSTAYQAIDAKKGILTGDLTMHGVTKPITINVEKIGEGDDPWGGYRVGFSGTSQFNLNEFGIRGPGPSSQMIYFDLSIEGIRQ